MENKKVTYAYIGCRTTEKRNARGKGISCYTIDERGVWKLKNITKTMDNPSYLAFDRTEQFLYTVHGDFHEVSAFRIEENGNLTFLQTLHGIGQNPVHLVPSLDNRFLFVASLQGGCVASLPRREDGTLGDPVWVEHLEGCVEGGVSHAHQCHLDHTGNFLLVPTQGRKVGYERVWVLKVDQATGKLSRASWVEARTYAEPRHIALTEDNKRAYLVNEKGNAVTFYDFDDAAGVLTPRQIKTTLPDTYTGQGQASAVLVYPEGPFVYASNRIHESLASYRVDEATGYLHPTGFVSCQGLTPRFMTFSPDNRQLVVANEDSDTLKFFAIDPDTGLLDYTGVTVPTESPTCVIFCSR